MPEVKFELPGPEYAAFTWVLQDEHGPSSAPPLLEGEVLVLPRGAAVTEETLPRTLRVNGFRYSRLGVDRGGGAAAGASVEPPVPLTVEGLRRWRTEWLPQVERVASWLEAFDPSTVKVGEWAATLQEQQTEYQRVFSGVHRATMTPVREAAMAFSDAFLAHVGESRRNDVLALLQGFPNCSLDRACALWDLSRQLRAAPELLEALDAGRELPDTPAGAAFKAAFDKLIARFGRTSNAELTDMPNWSEDHSIPMAAIRAYVRVPEERSPLRAATEQTARREQLEAELRQQAKSDSTLTGILELLPAAQQMLPNSEDHNYLADHRMMAANRRRWLNMGALLTERGVLGKADDVFYLTRSEVLAALEGNGAPPFDELQARRDRLAAARAVNPPPVLGRAYDGAIDTASPVESMAIAAKLSVIRGIAASRGSYRGRARVIETLADAGQLVEGDVLVCRSTTPPWSPFFGLISALVTNSGSPLSHGAIVAREFGLPAVVGTINGTALIPDGATVTVDGTNGLVIIESD
jgi:pyruvate,water dikinase